MNSDRPLALRKFLIQESTVGTPSSPPIENEIDLRSCAQVCFSSERPEHRIEHLFDGCAGEGASKWVGGRRDRAETILLIFDQPTDVGRCAFEAEECELARTQQVTAEYLLAGGDIYRQSFIQEFNFAPAGATYQRELIDLNLRGVQRLRFTILADKSGRGVPSLTALRFFSCPG